MAGRAEEDGVRVLAEAGSRTPETRAEYSLHAKSGRGDRSFTTTIHSTSVRKIVIVKASMFVT